MANPTPFTTLMSQIGKAEENAANHQRDAETHTARHEQARDAERDTKTVAKRSGTNGN